MPAPAPLIIFIHLQWNKNNNNKITRQDFMAQCLSLKPLSDVSTNKIRLEAIGGVYPNAEKICLTESK